jgi:hypothetical protein
MEILKLNNILNNIKILFHYLIYNITYLEYIIKKLSLKNNFIHLHTIFIIYSTFHLIKSSINLENFIKNT